MSSHRTWPAIAGVALLCLQTSLATAAAVRWGNAAGGNWNLTDNWVGGALPTASDTAVIDLAGDYTVTINLSPSIAALRVSGAAFGTQTVTATSRTLTLANASSIGAQGVLSLTSCTVNGAGALTNDGSLTLATTSVAQALTNNRTLTVNGSSPVNGAFANSAGAMLRVQGTTATATLTLAT